MDKRLLRYYERELGHLGGMAKEFAREHPKIAARLALDSIPCPDPYVERLLEGFAFLAARVQLKIDAEFPRFTQSLFETIAPQYLAPTPSMAMVAFEPEYNEAGLAAGVTVPRNTILRSAIGRGEQTACEYRTAHPVTLWPLQIAQAQYYTRDLSTLDLPALPATDRSRPGAPKAAVRIRFRATAGLPLNKIEADELVVHLSGADETALRLYETLLAHPRALVLRAVGPEGQTRGQTHEILPASAVHRVGFADDEALLPYDARGFHGYRLLHEYFAFPQRFLFVKFAGLRRALARFEGQEFDLIAVLREESRDLEGAVTADDFRLFCTPAINLFPKRADRIHVSDRFSEFRVSPDLNKALDYEVYRVTRVTGYGSRTEDVTEFRPFYAANDLGADAAYYAVSRIPRALTEREQRQGGARSSYTGSEVYISLVDAHAAPFSPDVNQLGVETLCTNRDVPLRMPVGRGPSDFSVEFAGPIVSTRVVGAPTPPRPSYAEGEFAWRLISHLSLNYLSITDSDQAQGAAALRELLSLYADAGESHVRKQIDAVRSIASRPVTRRVSANGPIAFARGLELTLTMEEAIFGGSGAFLLGSVLERFFAKYVSLNSFTETVVRTVERGEIMRWPAQVGQRQMI